MTDRIKRFLQDNWKFCLVIFLLVAFFGIFMTTYMQKEENRVTEPIIMNYGETTTADSIKKQLKVDSGTSREITHEIERIHEGKTQPIITYTVTAPTIDAAATKTARQIQTGDATLPKPVLEKTDRTVITSNPDKQTVDVYKINLRDNHKIKAGILSANNKAYLGLGYQAGRFEGIVYTHSGKKIDAVSVMYTIKQW